MTRTLVILITIVVQALASAGALLLWARLYWRERLSFRGLAVRFGLVGVASLGLLTAVRLAFAAVGVGLPLLGLLTEVVVVSLVFLFLFRLSSGERLSRRRVLGVTLGYVLGWSVVVRMFVSPILLAITSLAAK
ncbi:MAG: hypothetical protein H0S85_01430 [Desulfovibrionaceae bacterium]|jgi:hypothetical protein|nr:hypothetical protein [Desulfovibrionaceae bacterium]